MSAQERRDWSDDPRLTAYALGELEEAERVAFEAEIAGDEEAIRLAGELRALGFSLVEELTAEEAPGLTEGQHRLIEEQLGIRVRRPRKKFKVREWFAVAATVLFVGWGVTALMQEDESSRPDLGPRDSAMTVASGPAPPASEQLSELQGLGYLGDDSVSPQRRAGGGGLTKSESLVRGADGLVVDASREQLRRAPESKRVSRARGQVQSGGQAGRRALGELSDSEDDFLESRRGSDVPRQATEASREQYAAIFENPFQLATQEPLSTFSIDVDTASYANVRRFLEDGRLPPADAVRIEELVNYFPYAYAGPDGAAPFSVNVEVGSCPWAEGHRLVRVGLKGRETIRAERPSSNLVFLIDVSGSMNSPDKLPLLKQALHMLVQQLDERDTITIVVYASAQGVALPPTRCDLGVDIHMALERLSAGGSTNGGAGIQLAYQLAADNYVDGGINRVLLATDGDFNVGVTDDGSLVRMIEEKAKTGVFLTVLGFGTGNLQDSKMEQLADKGNGNYAYIDSVFEARKVLVEEMGATLETIAKDVKIQIEFNPVAVKGYRLIGYENRMLAAQDFNDDRKDAGEIGAGHTVTALYEIVPAGSELEVPGVDPLRYQTNLQPSGEAYSGEMLTLKLRYKEPEGSTSKLLVFPVEDDTTSFDELTGETRWAASVAAFGLILRDSRYRGTATLEATSRWAMESAGEDPGGYRAQFIGLVSKARQLK